MVFIMLLTGWQLLDYCGEGEGGWTDKENSTGIEWHENKIPREDRPRGRAYPWYCEFTKDCYRK